MIGSLEQVRTALIAVLDDESKLAMLNARVILRTGVNLLAINPRHARDPERIAKVIGALHEMGYQLF